ncbi:hypothetical protein [Methanosarcina sp. WWM596]|uniref:hypothetical protein n=1 Tax=Methanosarcina sp. WWM596 TaxID=1434103 RepID=UPI000615AD5A|nr:hypothetical protein [Methanosarcina sp. WWM596]AKB19276.1 hypothetical protein MSWHS_2413 [Methanosarcina sp. WWM596]
MKRTCSCLIPLQKNPLLLSSLLLQGDFSRVVSRPENAEVIEKHGVRMRVYITKEDNRNAVVLYQETETGHAEEFVHEKRDFFVLYS